MAGLALARSGANAIPLCRNRRRSLKPDAHTHAEQDLITDDEIISDSYNLKEIDGVAYEADCKKISIGGESFDVGGNPSAEEADEGLEDGVETVIDVVHSFRLNETSFDKKSYLTHLKGTCPIAACAIFEI